MGNANGHSKTHRYGSNAPPRFKYSPSNHSAQIPSSTASHANNMLSLPYAHVDSSLRALAGQAEGFGRLAIGGLHGPLYHVTTLAGHPHPSLFFCFIVYFLPNFPFIFCAWNSNSGIGMVFLDLRSLTNYWVFIRIFSYLLCFSNLVCYIQVSSCLSNF